MAIAEKTTEKYWDDEPMRLAAFVEADQKNFKAAVTTCKALVKKTRAAVGQTQELADDLLLCAFVLRQMMLQNSASGDPYWNWEMANYKDICEEAVEIYQEVGDKSGLALAKLEMSHAHLLHGEFEEGRDSAKEAHAIYKELDETSSQYTAMLVLADAELALGNELVAESAAMEVQSEANEKGSDFKEFAEAAGRILSKLKGRRDVKNLPPPEAVVWETEQGKKEAEATMGHGVTQAVYTQEVKRAMKHPFLGLQSPVTIENWGLGLMAQNLGVPIPVLRKVEPAALQKMQMMQEMGQLPKQ
mmetsp:Transcript_70001/g.130877  ORF Transcript_70001/g.130877 Transcript_70001/m.130877 type:complete len:302 (-) Transcript_70001:84-989(-)